jgi:hypothetical protein
MSTTVLQSIPYAMKIREELEQMVFNDLLGPVGGPTEEIVEQIVRDRYLVGMLAPKRQELSPEEFDEFPKAGRGLSRRVRPITPPPPQRRCSPRPSA